jgi:hypothetical protein
MNELLDLRPNDWTLIILPPRQRRLLLLAAARLAERGPLRVLDCGRQFDASVVARAARGHSGTIDRIHIQRAFICYEVARLLQQTPADQTPVLVLDMLSTFYDENVRLHTRRFLLESTLLQLKRLSRGAGLAVSVHAPPPSSDAVPLFKRLKACAARVLTYEMSVSASQQMRLF